MFFKREQGQGRGKGTPANSLGGVLAGGCGREGRGLRPVVALCALVALRPRRGACRARERQHGAMPHTPGAVNRV